MFVALIDKTDPHGHGHRPVVICSNYQVTLASVWMYRPFEKYLEHHFARAKVSVVKDGAQFTLKATHVRSIVLPAYQYINIKFSSDYSLYTTFQFLSSLLTIEQHYGTFDMNALIASAIRDTKEQLDQLVIHPVTDIILIYIF